MRIHILNDLHIEFESFEPPETDGDVIVLAGDIHVGKRGLQWAMEHFSDKPVIYVLGNHEYYKEAMPKFTSTLRREAMGSNVHVLENDSATIGNVRFLGCTLWTDFKLFENPRIAGHEAAQRMTDYRRIKVSPQYRKLQPIDTAGLHTRSVMWLKKELTYTRNQKTVVVTHHAPSLRSIPEGLREDILRATYASHLDKVVERSRACLWFHGHVHTEFDYRLGETRVVCNPRGYPDDRTKHFDSGFTVEV